MRKTHAHKMTVVSGGKKVLKHVEHAISKVHSATDKVWHDREHRVFARKQIGEAWKKTGLSKKETHGPFPHGKDTMGGVTKLPKKIKQFSTMPDHVHKKFAKIVSDGIKKHQEEHGLHHDRVRTDYWQKAMPTAFGKLKRKGYNIVKDANHPAGRRWAKISKGHDD